MGTILMRYYRPTRQQCGQFESDREKLGAVGRALSTMVIQKFSMNAVRKLTNF